MTQTTDDFMRGGSSSPAVKFQQIGDKVSGTVVSMDKREDRDPSGEIKVFANGDVKHVFAFELETDDGPRTLWVRGGLIKTLRDAAHMAGVGTLVGCHITVTFTGYGEIKTKGYAAPKMYTAEVSAPKQPRFGADDLV